MKLVLKLKEAVKLVDSSLSYDQLLDYIQKEYQLRKESIGLSFLDDEGDNITVMSDEDLEVMIAVHDGKQYVRINVEGEIEEQKEEKANDSLISDEPIDEVKQEVQKSVKVEEKAQPEPLVEIVEVKPEPQIEEPPKIEEEPVQEPIKEEPVVSEAIPEISAEQPQQEKKEEKEESGEGDHCRRRKWEKMQNYLNQTVARLVDQRIKALIPCIREQLAQQPEKPKQPETIVHEGYECKACLVSPITGIRYECPTCPLFSLCSECETKIDHEHNLLKIKKIVEKKAERECFFKGFFHGRGHHGRGSSSSKEKCGKRRNQWFDRKCWGLSHMFGGKPEDYANFVEENRGLKPRQTYKKYAETHNIAPEEFSKKMINLLCDQLSYSFSKPAEEFRKFVEENSELSLKQLVEMLVTTGVEKKENQKCWWEVKRQKDAGCEDRKPSCKKEKRCSKERQCKREKRCSKERECKKERKCSQERMCKKEKKCSIPEEPQVEEKVERVELKLESKIEQPKVEVSSIEISPSLLKTDFSKESTDTMRQKGQILLALKDLFGDSPDKNKEYFKFIEKNFSQGAERIISMWLDQHSGSI